MFGLEDMEGVKGTSSIKPQSIELSNVQSEYLTEVIPCVDTWKGMSAIEKIDSLKLIEGRIDEIRDISNNYEIDFASQLPEYMLEEYRKPFCDIVEFEDRSTFAVKEFFERDSCRDIPYATADMELRAEYMKDFYANYSEFSGYNPTLEFKEMPSNNMGAYNPETNTITLNSRLLENDNPYTTMETILHESRHAFQQYAVDHPWRVRVDSNTIAIWEDNLNYYIRPEWDFEAYEKQPIEADANSYAANVMNAGISQIS